jgi:hypothetical protein
MDRPIEREKKREPAWKKADLETVAAPATNSRGETEKVAIPGHRFAARRLWQPQIICNASSDPEGSTPYEGRASAGRFGLALDHVSQEGRGAARDPRVNSKRLFRRRDSSSEDATLNLSLVGIQEQCVAAVLYWRSSGICSRSSRPVLMALALTAAWFEEQSVFSRRSRVGTIGLR